MPVSDTCNGGFQTVALGSYGEEREKERQKIKKMEVVVRPCSSYREAEGRKRERGGKKRERWWVPTGGLNLRREKEKEKRKEKETEEIG